MTKEKVLVFPSSTIEAVEFANNHSDIYSCIAASSNIFNTNSDFFDEWKYIPYINEPLFLEELKKILQKYNIHKVFTSSSGIWLFLQNFIDTKQINIEIINRFKYKEADNFAKNFDKYSTRLYKYYKRITPVNNLTYIEFSSFLHNYHKIDGESGDNKFISLCHIAPFIPKGDIIEIGVQQGRSAFGLTMIARKYKIGKVLCIDPWIDIVQKDSPEIISTIGTSVDMNNLFFSFVLNLSLFGEDVNYVKTTSNNAIEIYKTDKTISSKEFGSTDYEQKIALLHIDGNHDYEYVYNDLYNYLPFVIDFGWIILDDYFWAFGDGPKKVGDDFLNKNKENINRCFYSDSALFIQIKCRSKL